MTPSGQGETGLLDARDGVMDNEGKLGVLNSTRLKVTLIH